MKDDKTINKEEEAMDSVVGTDDQGREINSHDEIVLDSFEGESDLKFVEDK